MLVKKTLRALPHFITFAFHLRSGPSGTVHKRKRTARSAEKKPLLVLPWVLRPFEKTHLEDNIGVYETFALTCVMFGVGPVGKEQAWVGNFCDKSADEYAEDVSKLFFEGSYSALYSL